MHKRSIENNQLTRKMGGVSAAVAVSRVLGYLRDAGIMYIFGAGALTDAYYAAFRITNFFRRTLGEGSLNTVFIPAFERTKTSGAKQGQDFFNGILNSLFIITTILTVAGIAAAVPLAYLLTYGLKSAPQAFASTITLTRLLFPQIIAVTAAAVFQGLLYSSGRFFLPAVAPVTFSLTILLYLCLLKLGLITGTPQSLVNGLAAAAVLGSVLSLPPLLLAARRAGIKPAFIKNPFALPGVKTTLLLLGPAAVCSAGDQISMFTGMIFASFLKAGSITALYNSYRIMQLPLALFGVAAATAVLPQAAKAAAAGDTEEVAAGCRGTLRLLLFLLLPATAGLIAIRADLTALLFEHGNFTAAQTAVTAGALGFAAPGLAAHGANKLGVMLLYAMGNWKTPLKIMLLQTTAEAALCLLLMGPLGVSGVTAASSAAAWLGCALTFTALKKRLAGQPLFAAGAFFKFAAASALMYMLCVAARSHMGGLHQAAALAMTVLCGIAAYAVFALLFKMEEPFQIIKGGRRA